MSHNFLPSATLSDARVWSFLKRVDEREAERCRSNGCPRCGGDLHGASYPRKPHALAPALREGVRRFSFCCSARRRRTTPPSAHFFGRRFRAAPVFLAACALLLRGDARLESAGRMLGIPAVTLRRWLRWWREEFPATPQWRWKRGELAAPPGDAPLVFLVRSMRGRSLRSRLLRSLAWLLPRTGFCAPGDGRAPPTESVSVAMA